MTSASISGSLVGDYRNNASNQRDYRAALGGSGTSRSAWGNFERTDDGTELVAVQVRYDPMGHAAA